MSRKTKDVLAVALIIRNIMADEHNEVKMVKIEGEYHERTTLSTLKKKTTERGFGLYEFKDKYGQKCSLQDSSLATESAIWFGVDVDLKGKEVFNRMHLTQEQVKALLPILTNFAETGEYVRDFEG